MSPRTTLECSKILLWSLCTMKPWLKAASRCSWAFMFSNLRFWHQNVTPLSQVIFRLISSKSQFFQRIWNQFQEAELHRNQNKTVKNASCNTLCLLDFPNIEQKNVQKHEISLLGGPTIMFSKSWKQWNPFGIWSEIWRKTRFWTFLVDPENGAEQCENF